MACAICAIISLGGTSPLRSLQHTRNSNETSSLLFLFCLAPDRGYLAIHITANAGGLLHHLFTITIRGWLSVSVALFRQVDPAPDVIRRRALWSADFPRPCEQSRDCPISLRVFIIHGGSRPVNAQMVDISGKDIKIEESFTSSRHHEELL